MLKRIPFLFLALMLACSTSESGSFLHFDYQGAEAMVKVLQALHEQVDRDSVEKLLDAALDLEAFQVSHERSANPRRSPESRVSLEEYRTFLLSFRDDQVNTQGNQRLAFQEEFYRDAIADPARFAEALRVVQSTPDADFQEALKLALQWLPGGTVLDAHVWVLFDIGGSGGWMYRTSDGRDHIGFNLLHLPAENGTFDGELFLGTLAHELQHMGLPLNGYRKLIHYSGLADTSRLKLFTDFITPIIGEGMANKFCSNAPSKFSKKVNPDKPFAARPEVVDDWKTFEAELVDIHGRAVHDLGRILHGEIGDVQQFRSDYRNYWTWRAGELEGKRFLLGRRYYYGGEILGVIYEAFGRDAVLETVADLRHTLSMYNQALTKLQPDGYEKYLFPQDLVEMAREL